MLQLSPPKCTGMTTRARELAARVVGVNEIDLQRGWVDLAEHRSQACGQDGLHGAHEGERGHQHATAARQRQCLEREMERRRSAAHRDHVRDAELHAQRFLERECLASLSEPAAVEDAAHRRQFLGAEHRPVCGNETVHARKGAGRSITPDHGAA